MKKLLLTFGAAMVIATATTALPTQSRAWDGGGYWAPELRFEPHPLTNCHWWWGFQWQDECRYYRIYHRHYRRHRERVIHVRG